MPHKAPLGSGQLISCPTCLWKVELSQPFRAVFQEYRELLSSELCVCFLLSCPPVLISFVDHRIHLAPLPATNSPSSFCLIRVPVDPLAVCTAAGCSSGRWRRWATTRERGLSGGDASRLKKPRYSFFFLQCDVRVHAHDRPLTLSMGPWIVVPSQASQVYYSCL